MIALILSLYLHSVNPLLDVKYPVVQEYFSADQEESDPLPTDLEDSPADQEESDPLPTDLEDSPADQEEVDPLPTDSEDSPADQEEVDPLPTDSEDSPADQEEVDPLPTDSEDPPADQEESDPVSTDSEDSLADLKQQKDAVKEYEQVTIYQTIPVEADSAASESLDYLEESYYLLSMICAVLLFFLVICICKYIYKFFDIFI